MELDKSDLSHFLEIGTMIDPLFPELWRIFLTRNGTDIWTSHYSIKITLLWDVTPLVW
jgi:hypothetical protein